MSQPLLPETLALVVGRSILWRRSPGADGAQSGVTDSAKGIFATRKQIDRDCRQHGIQPKVQMEANSISAVLTVVERTSLATLLPAAIVQGRDDLTAIELTLIAGVNRVFDSSERGPGGAPQPESLY